MCADDVKVLTDLVTAADHELLAASVRLRVAQRTHNALWEGERRRRDEKLAPTRAVLRRRVMISGLVVLMIISSLVPTLIFAIDGPIEYALWIIGIGYPLGFAAFAFSLWRAKIAAQGHNNVLAAVNRDPALNVFSHSGERHDE